MKFFSKKLQTLQHWNAIEGRSYLLQHLFGKDITHEWSYTMERAL
jgi:hypothetical protein